MHTYTHTQPFYGSVEIVRDNPGESVPEETFTHYTHHDHRSSLSAFSIYYDTWHPPYTIHVLYSLFPQYRCIVSIKVEWVQLAFPGSSSVHDVARVTNDF